MKTKIILKGMLLYTTILVVIAVISVIDIIINRDFIYPIIVCVVLCYTCYRLLSKEEFETLTFSKWLQDIEEKSGKQ